MAARVTGEELVRWAMRLCSRRLLWQQCGTRIAVGSASFGTVALQDTRTFTVWHTRSGKAGPAGHQICPVRYFSQGWTKETQRPLSLTLHSLPSSGAQPEDRALEPITKKPLFYEQLKECVSPTDVLDLVSQYTATHRRVSNCLTHMWDVSKKMTDDQRRYELQLMHEHPVFEELLHTAMEEAAKMRHEDLMYSLYAMVKLGVSQRSRVVQTILRVCQETLNSLNEKSLSVLATTLDHMEDSANVLALKEGMRLVVVSRLPSIKKVLSLQTMMRLVGKDAPLDLKKKLEKKALSMVDQFTLANSQYMISTMATMGFYSRPLLDVCSQKVAENTHGIPFHRLLLMLRSCYQLHYRDMTLLTAMSDYLASSAAVWSNKQMIFLVSAFEDLGFCPTALLEAFAERLMASPDSISQRDLLSILKCYSSLNYHPQDNSQQFLETMSRVLEAYLPKMLAHEVLKAVYWLCLLGHFPSVPLERLVDSSVLEELSAAGEVYLRHQEKKLQVVDVCLRLDRPSLPRPLAFPPGALGVAFPGAGPVNPALTRCLRALMDRWPGATLEETVVVENLYLIDGVITKSSAVTEGVDASQQEAPTTADNQRIAVICVPQVAFCYGTSHPRGNLAIKIRHLKILGYTPVLVKEQELESLSEGEMSDTLRTILFPELQDPAIQAKS